MEKKNFQLTISYDGTDFFGWQQTRCGPSIEESLKIALTTLFKEELSIQAASRTDRGVHAKGQIVSFCTSFEIDLSTLHRKLNALLPKAIHIQEIKEAAPNFHPSLDALSKEYRYFICNRDVQHPTHRLFSWHIHEPLDWDQMRRAADYLKGSRDFSALSNQKTEDARRQIEQIQIEPLEGGRLFFSIRGDRFLYKMARNIAGLLVYSGLKKIDPPAIPFILDSKKRANAAITAPAHGLFLWNVLYPKREE